MRGRSARRVGGKKGEGKEGSDGEKCGRRESEDREKKQG